MSCMLVESSAGGTFAACCHSPPNNEAWSLLRPCSFVGFSALYFYYGAIFMVLCPPLCHATGWRMLRANVR